MPVEEVAKLIRREEQVVQQGQPLKARSTQSRRYKVANRSEAYSRREWLHRRRGELIWIHSVSLGSGRLRGWIRVQLPKRVSGAITL
jgi:hypothetical protein